MGLFGWMKKDKTTQEKQPEAAQAEETKVEEPKAEETKTEETKAQKPAQTEAQKKPAGRTTPWIHQETGIAFCGDDRNVYLEILNDYCTEGRDYQEKLRKCREEEDWKNYAVYVHAVKSSSKTIGAEDFSEEARMHEMAAKEGNISVIHDDWDTFCANFEQVIREAESIIG